MQRVSHSGPFDDEGSDPEEEFDFGSLFESFGAGGDPNDMLSSLMQLFGGGGFGAMPGGGLDSALNLAISIASGGRTESNVDPVDRIAMEQLARVAELQITQATGPVSYTHLTLPTIYPV